MNRPEFVALQVSVLIRGDETKVNAIQAFLESVEFKYEMQEELGRLIQNSLRNSNVPFDEVIISLDKPPERAKPIERTRSSDKPSVLARLFGRK